MTQAAPDPSSDSVCANPACGAANRAGTRFCAACGTPLSGQSASPPAAPPPEPPRYQPAVTSMPASPGTSVDVAMAAEWAYNHASQALQAMQAEIAVQSPPSALTAVILKKAIGNPLRFRCQLAVLPTGPATSRITYAIKVEWNSTFLMLGLIAAAGAFNIMFLTMSVGLWAPLLSAVALGWAVYDYAIGLPNRLGGQLHKALAGAAPVPPQAPAAAPQPVAQPVVAEPSVPAPVAEDDIVARIEKLATLRDKGLITDAEFERRRAEWLDRL